MTELINGPCSALGYRAIWHILEMEGLRIPRVIVQDLLKKMDPEGSELRRKHRLKRRVYQNPGPNYSCISIDVTNLSVRAFLSMVQLMDLAGGFCAWKLLVPITHQTK